MIADADIHFRDAQSLHLRTDDRFPPRKDAAIGR